MIDDTRIGGPSSRFPATRRSAIVASSSPLAEERRRAFDSIVAAYWKPVYAFIRLRWPHSGEHSKDLTQAFFTRAIEKELFKDYRAEKGSFRTFIRTCVTHFVINESKHAQRQKRGGDTEYVPLDANDPAGDSLEKIFEKEWVRNMFELALEDLRQLCVTRSKCTHFELFERYDLEHCDLSYSELALEFAISPTDVTNYLSWSRREFRRLVLDRIREITVDDAEFRREARVILGKRT